MVRHSGTLMKHLIISVSVVGIVIVIAALISYGEVVSELYGQFLRARGKIPQRAHRVYNFLRINLPNWKRILFLRFFAYGLVLVTLISVILLLPGNEFLHVKLIV